MDRIYSKGKINRQKRPLRVTQAEQNNNLKTDVVERKWGVRMWSGFN
jgi:hypothetical protein